MADAPERIWAKIHGASTDVMSGQRGLLGAWHECQREGHTSYIRADLAAAMEAENQRLREALAGLELACDQLAATRTREVYLAMIDSGQQAALLFLDSHRGSARAALSSTEASHE